MSKAMKIGCLIFGNTVADTAEVIAEHNLNLSDCERTNRQLNADDIARIHQSFDEALPPDCVPFYRDCIITEHQAIDIEPADLYVVYPFGGISDVQFAALMSKNKPIVIAPCPYGQYWSYGCVYYPYFVRDNREISRYLGISEDVSVVDSQEELKKTLYAYQVKFRMENAVVLCVGEPMYEPFHSFNWGYSIVKAVQQKFGLQWMNISSEKILQMYDSFDKEYAHGEILKDAAENHVKDAGAFDRVERLYQLFKALIEKYEVDGFTVNCLASIVHTTINGTACYSLSKLNDAGVVAACESDVTTLMAMMITSFASRRPAFMLNPYLFPADNKLFVSHCSSPTRHSLAKDDAQRDDMRLYNYFEIPHMGCGIQVLREEGAEVTITGLSHNSLDRMVVVKGRIVRNTSFASCRTQLEIQTEGSIRELAEAYQGRHWALVYGDQTDAVVRANRLLRIESILI